MTDALAPDAPAVPGPVAASASLAPAARSIPAEPPREIWFKRRISLGTALRELWEARGLIATLAERDIRARYKQTYFGAAWAVITPLALMLVFSVFLTRAAKIPHPGAPYILFTYVALVPWTFFSSAVSLGGQSLLGNMAIVHRIYCPREVFPIAAVIVAAFDALVSTLVLAVLFAIEGFAPKPETVYAVLPLIVLTLFALAVCMLMSVALVYLRDLRHALPLILQLGLFATPVAYGISFLAKSNSAQYLYSALNPVAPVIDALRRTILLGHAPHWGTLAIGTASTLVTFVASYRIFKWAEAGIADFS